MKCIAAQVVCSSPDFGLYHKAGELHAEDLLTALEQFNAS